MTPQGRVDGESHARRGVQINSPAELSSLGDKAVVGCLQVSLHFRSSLPYPPTQPPRITLRAQRPLRTCWTLSAGLPVLCPLP